MFLRVKWCQCPNVSDICPKTNQWQMVPIYWKNDLKFDHVSLVSEYWGSPISFGFAKVKTWFDLQIFGSKWVNVFQCIDTGLQTRYRQVSFPTKHVSVRFNVLGAPPHFFKNICKFWIRPGKNRTCPDGTKARLKTECKIPNQHTPRDVQYSNMKFINSG